MSATDLTAPHAVRARPRARAARGTPAMPEAPWSTGDRVVTAVVVAVGMLLIVIAWVGASDTTDWDTQLSWTALSMAGVVVVCTGVGIWLFRGFARVRREAGEVRRALAGRITANAPTPTDVRSDRVTVAGMAHHHAPGCLLVTGKTTVAADEASLARCGICG